eukprot:TRINITY_DN3274_c0_g1_i1.p1 TRINITY_DN3274_c0_g1~~TRINITY_DN3274_c0_g1_i1.p1  ORF type:complete len:347 (+),score=70.77 TRINITY_DN3274_c0_g1_i1:140-1042(+)
MNVKPEEHKLCTTEPFMMSATDRAKWLEILIEKFGIESVCSTDSIVTTLFASGRTTGLVVDVGCDTSRIAAIHEGIVLNHAAKKLNLGGKDCSEFLHQKVTERGYQVSKKDVDMMKEKMAFCVRNYQEEMNHHQDDEHKTVFSWPRQPVVEIKEHHVPDSKFTHGCEYELPDGQVITLGSERYQCAELLFSPHLVITGSEQISVPQACVKVALLLDPEMGRFKYLGNIVVAGGGSMFPHFQDKLQHEVLKCYIGNCPSIKIIAPPERTQSAWIGAAILSSLSSTKWISKQEYEEAGVVEQ